MTSDSDFPAERVASDESIGVARSVGGKAASGLPSPRPGTERGVLWQESGGLQDYGACPASPARHGTVRRRTQPSVAGSSRRYSVFRNPGDHRLRGEARAQLRRLGWFLPQPADDGTAALSEDSFDRVFESMCDAGVPGPLFNAAREVVRVARRGWPGPAGQCALLNAVGFTHDAGRHQPRLSTELLSAALVIGWVAQHGLESTPGQLQADVVKGIRNPQLRQHLLAKRSSAKQGPAARPTAAAEAAPEDQPLLFSGERSSAGSEDPFFDGRPPPRTHLAAMYVQDALEYQPTRPYAETPEALRAHRKRLMLYYPVWLAILLLLLLSFVSQPPWCQQSRHCGDPAYPQWPTAGTVEREWSLSYETAAVLLLCYDFWLWMMLLGPAGTWSWKTRQFHGFILIVYCVDLAYAWMRDIDRFRLGTYLRPVFYVCYSSEVQRELWFLTRAARDFVKILCLLTIYVVVLAWFAVVFFPNDEPEGLAYFHELTEGIWHLQVLLTTNNAPDIWIPAYQQNRWTVLIFVVFVVVGLWIFLNLFTAVIYASYMEANKSARDDMLRNQQKAMDRAFDCLVNARPDEDLGLLEIDRNLLLAVFAELNQNSDVRYIDTEEANVLFGLMDNTGDGMVDRKEFRMLPYLLNLEFDEFHGSDSCFLATNFPDLWQSAPMEFIRELVRGRHTRTLDMVIDCILVANGALVVFETRKLIMGETLSQGDLDAELHGWQFLMDTLFTAVYFIEMTLKIAVTGWEAYWKGLRNCFDGFVTLLAVASSLYIAFPNGYSNPQLLRWVVMGRLLRLVRLLGQVPDFETIFSTLVTILPDVKKAFLVMFCVLYYFSALGTDIYGGRINTDPESVYHAALAGGNGTKPTDFAKGNWYAMNFNDVAGGFVMLFACLIMNNWDSYVEAYVAVSDANPWWTRLFFTAFWVLGTLASLNIIISAILEKFMQRTLEGAPRQGHTVVRSGDYDELKWDESKGMWQFESELITGTQTHVKRTYHVRYAGDIALLPEQWDSEEKFVRHVFTRCSIFEAPKDHDSDSSGSTPRQFHITMGH